MFSHNGGNTNGEFSLFGLLNDTTQSTRPWLSIVSSDAMRCMIVA